MLLFVCSLCYAGQPRGAAVPNQSAAAVALFVNSNPGSARTLASSALRRNPRDLDALFVEMEAAGLEADTAGELDAALHLCETGLNDPRVDIASARILDMAGNTQQFRAALPRIHKLIKDTPTQQIRLRLAEIAAIAEGATGPALSQLTQEAGLITNWRVAGPFGSYPNSAFDRTFAPEHDGLSQPSYDGHVVESFQFPDGTFTLADYLPPDGVYYATSKVDIPAGGIYQLRLESAGTLKVAIDGKLTLSKDNRLRSGAQILWSPVQLMAGSHTVQVKFVPSAAPFRISLFPAHDRSRASTSAIAAAEASYISAAERFWIGDYSSAIAQLTDLKRRQPSVSVDLLLAHTWAQTSQDAPEIPALLESALKQAPLALAARYEQAQRAYDAGHYDEAYRGAQSVAAAQPEYVPAQQLLADTAIALNWQAEAARAFETELRLYPTCSTLRGAAKFYNSISAYERAAQLEKQLDGCAPGSLAYAQMLSKAGRHAEAAVAAQKVATEYPLDRNALVMLARELSSAGSVQSADEARKRLLALAPNTPQFTLSERPSSRARAFTSTDFYQDYRRNGLYVVRQAANRHFSGGPAVILLDEHVAQLEPDGSVALYVHNITRVLNRDGIEKYGEVALPSSAELLELRTIKQDGSVVEPEFSQHKSTVSMPALAPGAAIEQEYVVRHDIGGISGHPDVFSYTFGSFAAPIISTRFVTLTPEHQAEVVSHSTPAPRQSTANGITVRVWEQQDIAQWAQEVSAPRTGTLPEVRLVPSRAGRWEDVRSFYRDELLPAIQIGPRVEAAAREQRGATPEETARNLYRIVTSRLRSTEASFEGGGVASAEDTLTNFAGSRTTALLAMARAAGLDAELLLARDVTSPRPEKPELATYSHPLVLFHLSGKDIVADAETAGLAFGIVPPGFSHDDALLVPVHAATSSNLMVALPASAGDELSIAEGDVTFDAQGNLQARLTIRMGASRSSQMRSILSGIEPSGRRHFFEQLALRIFPGVSEASGEVQNEYDAEKSLVLIVNCRASRFLNFNGSVADIEQLAPALGLRRMYGLGSRRLPLYVDMPLVETTVFHVYLAKGFRLAARAADLRTRNEFGTYALEFSEKNEGAFDVRRTFRIPVQVIAPERFDAFAQFARQIDDAERQRLTISTATVNTAGH
jgi:tetratricopeptide (TPR) repeat protein